MVNEPKKNFDTSVTLSGLRLDNPVVPASGTFGYGNEYKDFYDINILGSFSFKGTTREARFGNPTPRIAECTAGMINAVGLQNPGIDAVIGEELPRLKTFFRKPVIYGRNTTVRPFSLHRMNIGTASLSCTPATFHFTT